MSLLRRFLLCSAMMLWSSVFLSLAFARTAGTTFLSPGGRHGWYIAAALLRNIGMPEIGYSLLVFATLPYGLAFP